MTEASLSNKQSWHITSADHYTASTGRDAGICPQALRFCPGDLCGAATLADSLHLKGLLDTATRTSPALLLYTSHWQMITRQMQATNHKTYEAMPPQKAVVHSLW